MTTNTTEPPTAESIVVLSATCSMPLHMWHDMRPVCRTCEQRHGESSTLHRWESFSREQWLAHGAQQLVCGGGDVILVFPLSVIWQQQPYCFLHHVVPEWDGAWRDRRGFTVQGFDPERSFSAQHEYDLEDDENLAEFGVQDMTPFSILEPLSMVSFSRGPS